MLREKKFYAEETETRKRKIVKWFIRDEKSTRMFKSLQYYLDYGDISEFEDYLNNITNPPYHYIVSNGLSESFAEKIISQLGMKKTDKEEGRQFGYVKGERVEVKKVTIYKNRAIYRDAKGRFVSTKKRD